MKKIISLSLMMFFTSMFAGAETYKGSSKCYLVATGEYANGNPVLIFDLVENGGTFSQTAPFVEGTQINTLTDGSISGSSLEINFTMAVASAPDTPILRYEIRGEVFDRYRATDFQALKKFLEQPSAVEGKTNGQVIDNTLPAVLPFDDSWVIRLERNYPYFVWVVNHGNAYLQTINLPSKNLAGEADFYNLGYLDELDLRDNAITGVKVASSYIGTVRLSQNAIPLSKLPIPTNFSSWEYQPQTITENIEYSEDESIEIDLSSEKTIDGKSTQFIWTSATGVAVLVSGVDYTENNGVFTFSNPAQFGAFLRCTTLNETFMTPTNLAWTDYDFLLSPQTPAAIGDITADGRTVTGYYSIMGVKLQDEPANGIYIILYDNGSTEKRIK